MNGATPVPGPTIITGPFYGNSKVPFYIDPFTIYPGFNYSK